MEQVTGYGNLRVFQYGIGETESPNMQDVMRNKRKPRTICSVSVWHGSFQTGVVQVDTGNLTLSGFLATVLWSALINGTWEIVGNSEQRQQLCALHCRLPPEFINNNNK